MTTFEFSDDLPTGEEVSQPKKRIAVKLLVMPVILAGVLLPLSANGQNFGRWLDTAQGAWNLIRRQQTGGNQAQPTQAQVDTDARNQARMEAAERAAREAGEFYRSVNGGNTRGIFSQALRIFGEFGLIDPARARETAGESVPPGGGGGGPIGLGISGNPTTVSESIQVFNYGALRPSLATQTSLQAIFGPEGQKLLAQQRQQMSQLTTGAQELAQLTAEDAKINAEIANENAALVNRISTLGNQSRTLQASQDVLKNLAEQSGLSGQIFTGLSLQNERMGNTLSSLSGQLSILQSQGDLQSFQLTQQLLTQAGMSSQLVQVEGEIRDAHNYTVNRDLAASLGAVRQQSLFIYGLNAEPNYGLPVPTGSTLANLP